MDDAAIHESYNYIQHCCIYIKNSVNATVYVLCNDWTNVEAIMSHVDHERWGIVTSQSAQAIVQLFVENGMNVDAVDEDGNTCMHYASLHGDIGVLKILIGKGAKTDVINKKGESVAEWWKMSIPLEVSSNPYVRIFAENGGRMDAKDAKGKTIIEHLRASAKKGKTPQVWCFDGVPMPPALKEAKDRGEHY